MRRRLLRGKPGQVQPEEARELAPSGRDKKGPLIGGQGVQEKESGTRLGEAEGKQGCLRCRQSESMEDLGKTLDE